MTLSAAAAKPALLLLLLGGLGAAGWLAVDALSSDDAKPPAGGPAMGGGKVSNLGAPGHRIDVTGTLTGTPAPGGAASLDVTITNTNSQAIVVRSVSGTITAVTSGGLAGRPACDKSWYSLGSFTGTMRIERGASDSVQLPVVLQDLTNVNQDNCKGATFTYTFTAAAQQA
jgi:hypothetical protein